MNNFSIYIMYLTICKKFKSAPSLVLSWAPPSPPRKKFPSYGPVVVNTINENVVYRI